jgi:dTDP-4-dehydrorhamnose reductase
VKQYISLLVNRAESITAEEYPTPAKRPPNSVLDCSLFKKHFSIHPRHWQVSLVSMINIMLSTNR